ncbi:uncharacterized protein LOC128203634 [Mya arenaria]|uniref:uncharacterized protein LOC128203634 n=1 Tax=Mya arenaria TaxID=6604 RepID=UPI0022E26EDC|nr:uncharacterized protein LOC128203634 [Mya arenaria]
MYYRTCLVLLVNNTRQNNTVIKIDREKKVEQIYAKLIKTLPAPGDTFKKCYHCSEQVRVTHPSMLQRGMHITMPGKKLMWLTDLIKKEIPDFPFIYKHHAIITEVGEVNGQTVKLTLIHANNEEPHVSKRTETIDLKKEYLWIVKYKRKTLDNEAIAKAAEKQFEKKAPGKYHVLKRNCEHFATSCTLGEDQSVQVENLLSAVGGPLPGLIPGCQGLFRIITTVLDEIATGLFGSVAFAGIVLSVAGLANVLYTILMTVGYRKMEKENKLCPCCFKRKILELWMNLAVFIPTSALTFVLCNVAVPLATLPGIGISIVVILLTLLTQWGMSRIIRAICSPFDIEGSPV